MKEELHRLMSEAVARAVDFPDPDAVARASSIPDEIHTFSVPGLGTEFAGHNLTSLTHFRGYNLGMDRSLGHLELPNVSISYVAGAWPEIPLGMESSEPLFLLLQVKGYTHAFDEITFPACWSYARWLELCYSAALGSHRDPTPAARNRRLGTIAGMILHFAQDAEVPEHRRNELLAHHSSFEAEQLARWKAWTPTELQKIVTEEVDKAAAWSPRDVVQAAASQATPPVPFWSCRRRKLVVQSIRDSIRCSAAILRYLPQEG